VRRIAPVALALLVVAVGCPSRPAAAPGALHEELVGVLDLPAHLGLARVGNMRLKTEIVDKGGEKLYHVEDELGIDAAGFGFVKMTVTGDFGADLSVRDLVLEVWSPGSKVKSRRLAVAPEGDALVLTDTEEDAAPVKSKLAGLGKKAILLTPPLGAGDRLARLGQGDAGTRLSFEAWDLALGAKADLTITLGEEASIDVRGVPVKARRVRRTEGAAVLEAWLEPKTRELLRLSRDDVASRVTFVGRESATAKEDLPSPPARARATEGPAEAVLRFLRATGRGDQAEVEDMLDLDALYARAVAAGKASADDVKFKKVFEKTVVSMLTSDEWRRGESLKLLTNATRLEDLTASVNGDAASVRPASTPDAPGFTLRKTDAGWKITALPEK
jgi:hypothetical protein